MKMLTWRKSCFKPLTAGCAMTNALMIQDRHVGAVNDVVVLNAACHRLKKA